MIVSEAQLLSDVAEYLGFVVPAAFEAWLVTQGYDGAEAYGRAIALIWAAKQQHEDGEFATVLLTVDGELLPELEAPASLALQTTAAAE